MSQQPSNPEIELMRQALALAASARGDVEPTPMVGCIIHREGRVIGKGWHRRFGAAHAEPDALSNCSEDPRGACAVVTLEPCCHTNKKTPPCVPALLRAGIAREEPRRDEGPTGGHAGDHRRRRHTGRLRGARGRGARRRRARGEGVGARNGHHKDTKSTKNDTRFLVFVSFVSSWSP